TRPGLADLPEAEGAAQGRLAAPADRARLHEPVDPRLLGLLRLPARNDGVPVVPALRLAQLAEGHRLRQLQVPARRDPLDRPVRELPRRRRPPDLAGDQ